MPSLPGLRTRVWLLPVVLVVCALMVLPGASIFGTAIAPAPSLSGLEPGSSSSAAATSPGPSAGSSVTPTTGVFHTPLNPTYSQPSSFSPLAPPSAGSPSVVAIPSDAPAWLKSVTSTGKDSEGPRLASVPNLDLIDSSSSSPAAYVAAAYQNPPAPTGLVDYGIGTTNAYSYNTTHILATVVLNTPPNVTNPSSEGVIDPVSNTGLVGSLYEFSLQLNTVLSNVTLPGVANGTLWTQNVLDINDTGIHFVDDVFNFTYDSGVVFPTTGPASIVSGCGTTDLDTILAVYGGVYQCVGGTIPITAASYPVTIQLYNNASVNAQEMDQVAFGYRIVGGTTLLGTGVSDTVVFNNTAAPAPPTRPVAFEINGFQKTPPTGVGSWLYDAEIIFGGAIGGLNAVFRSLNGTLSLQYSNTTSGPWRNIPSAYDFGADTAESAVGISEVWTPSHVVDVSQGPSFLYGLWNSLTRVAVASGSIQFSGTVDPTYGFVFVSNLAAPGVYDTNMSWVPTTEAGTYDTYLPPAIPLGGVAYTTRMYAAGVTEENGTAFSTSQTGYTFPTPTHSAIIRAPLYMRGNAQAASLAYNVTGRALTSTGPYVFSNLVVYLPFAFTHINDYYYPSFTILQAEGLTTTPIYVNNTVQGNNDVGLTVYERDRATAACGLTGGWDYPPGCYYSFTNYSEQINIFDSAHARVTNETLYGDLAYGTPGVNGGTVLFFQDTDAYASNITATDASYGVFNGLSTDSRVQNISAEYESNGVDDVGSTGTVGWHIYAYYIYSFGVYAIDSWSGTFTWINATDYAYGYDSGYYYPVTYYALTGSHSTHVSEVNATDYALGAWDSESYHDTLTTFGTYEGAGAVEAVASFGTTVTGVSAFEAWGVVLFYDDYTNITKYVVSTGDSYDSIASEFADNVNTALTDATLNDYDLGVLSGYNTFTSFTNLVAENSPSDLGVYSLDDTSISFTNVWVNDTGAGAELYYPTGDTFSNVNVNVGSVAGMFVYYGVGTVVTGLTTDTYYGGLFYYSTDGTVTGVTATDDSIGVYLYDCSYFVVSHVTASDSSIGVLVDPSSWITVSTVTVSGYSIGVVLDGSSFSTVSGVTATNTSLSAPFVNDVFGWPVGAVDTYDTTASTVANVVATLYPGALFDEGSTGLTVSGLNATSGYYGVYLEDTYMSTFSGVDAYKDFIGFLLTDDSYENTVTAGSFVDDTSYGVILNASAEDNTIYDNSFIGNNGATSTYSAAHIQAWSGAYNYFDICSNYECTSGIGNYWADWHTYGPDGYLAPYLVTGDVWDYFPTGPQGMFSVTFSETGLPSGTHWSVTLGGVTMSSAASTITFAEPSGSYAFQVIASGWSASPASGTVSVTGTAYNVSVTFSEVAYALTLSESGLATGTSWSATVNGVTQSTTGTSLVFYVPAGSFTYAFNAVSGYNLPSTGASGSGTVTTSPMNLATTYSVVSPPSNVSTSTYDTGFAIAVAIAAIALLLALLALFWRRKSKPGENPPPPSAWTPPPGTGSSPPPAGGTGPGSSQWSEGSGPGGG